jgi:hypothetical protein
MVKCVRCNVPLVFQGMKEFHEGRRWGALGDLGELFVEKFEGAIYECPKCGAIELFDPEVGVEERADNPMADQK